MRIRINASDATVSQADNTRVVITSLLETSGLRIEVWERDSADLEVAFFVPNKRGNPFEQVLIGSASEEDAVASAAVQLVADFVAERTVLAWDRRLLRGGRQFIEVDKLSTRVQNLAWVISWRGTYNSDAPAV